MLTPKNTSAVHAGCMVLLPSSKAKRTKYIAAILNIENSDLKNEMIIALYIRFFS
jgi:hypothetical protein